MEVMRMAAEQMAAEQMAAEQMATQELAAEQPWASRRHTRWMGLQVSDADLYARYREHMLPHLQAHGGYFTYDFQVSEVLKSPGPSAINRVFMLSFPDRETCERFFSDPVYLEIRARYFEPAVQSVTRLASYDEAS
jgi:uncharacterized protein (DUF1330 family)